MSAAKQTNQTPTTETASGEPETDQQAPGQKTGKAGAAAKDEKDQKQEQQPALDAARTPEKTVIVDDRTKELLRIANNAERTFIDSMGHLIAASSGSASGATEVFTAAAGSMKHAAQAVRNAAMNHAVFVADEEGA